MEKRYDLGAHGRHLWTRELGRTIRAEVEEFLGDRAPGDSVVINAEGVEVFDYSFASELFGKLILSLPREYPGRFLIVEGLTTYARENLEKTLVDLGLALIYRKGRKLQLMGKVHPADEETFDAVAKSKGKISASELGSNLGVGLTAMNERLGKLAGLGLVLRDKGASPAGREQYLYTAPL
ncbi:MAG TPA: DUF4325 domain-containing protein [Thermoleophilia bacterium]|nr:DUF4325 domain-containing protein [Thermoleophilia bacterium]